MNNSVEIFTIGFTQKTAQNFFETLKKAGVKRVIDTRLNNVSQLAGFAKKTDLAYFLKTIGDIEYFHFLEWAPTQDILDEYKKKKGNWETYEQKFLHLIETRKIEKKVDPDILDSSCLLCSEAKHHHCHRRLVAEYLQQRLKVAIQIKHL
ncbi:DUF488 family protein [[Phormidium] sp. ETS-05]|uniref:DUF488 domain-containing protein n=1 Tax=[Phormidium] sp. ETS-05 TaxID=222819 RepID=UPI0018EF2146|nr:DUF488 domain-containing protein [[Phormidium] sp. ETS-05]